MKTKPEESVSELEENDFEPFVWLLEPNENDSLTFYCQTKPEESNFEPFVWLSEPRESHLVPKESLAEPWTNDSIPAEAAREQDNLP